MGNSASLNPNDAVPEIVFETVLKNNEWKPDEIEDHQVCRICGCASMIKWGARVLTKKLRRPGVDIVSCAIKIGMKQLRKRNRSDIDIIKNAAEFVFMTGKGDPDDLKWFFNGDATIDMETSIQEDYLVRIYASAVQESDLLSRDTGFSKHAVRQIAIMNGFIFSETMPKNYIDQMEKVIERFDVSMEKRAIRAESIRISYT